jgi:hypothetical protein
MSVSITEIIQGASVHAVPLAGECAGYLVLAAADQAVAAPRRIGPGEVHLEGDGRVRVDGARAAAEADSEGDLRALLDALLVNSSSATPALLRASRRAPGRGIAAFVREIETALIPVNRAAAHRSLARLERETERARQKGHLELAAEPAVARSERASAVVSAPQPVPVPPTPAPPDVVPVERPLTPPPPASESLDEIPSLFAPPVEAIAAYAAEIETRPEPIVARRSAPPPPAPIRTPSNAPPVVETLRATPVFGTVVQSIFADDDLEIDVVLDDEFDGPELADEELTGVLVRSAPLEVSAMLDAAVPELTERCPPALEDDVALPYELPETTFLLAEASEIPSVAEASEIPSVAEASEIPSVAEANDPFAVELPPDGAVELAVAAAPSEPFVAEVLLEESVPALDVEDDALELVTEGSEAEPVATIVLPRVAPAASEVPLVEEPNLLAALEGFTLAGDSREAEPLEAHGETEALALGFEPVVAELAPEPRRPMPKPRPSDVDDLLGRMVKPSVDATDDVRTSLKSLAGLEPTPPPPEPKT